MTNTDIFKQGNRWVIRVTHPEAPMWCLTCATEERAAYVAHLIRNGQYTGC